MVECKGSDKINIKVTFITKINTNFAFTLALFKLITYLCAIKSIQTFKFYDYGIKQK